MGFTPEQVRMAKELQEGYRSSGTFKAQAATPARRPQDGLTRPMGVHQQSSLPPRPSTGSNVMTRSMLAARSAMPSQLRVRPSPSSHQASPTQASSSQVTSASRSPFQKHSVAPASISPPKRPLVPNPPPRYNPPAPIATKVSSTNASNAADAANGTGKQSIAREPGTPNDWVPVVSYYNNDMSIRPTVSSAEMAKAVGKTANPAPVKAQQAASTTHVKSNENQPPGAKNSLVKTAPAPAVQPNEKIADKVAQAAAPPGGAFAGDLIDFTSTGAVNASDITLTSGNSNAPAKERTARQIDLLSDAFSAIPAKFQDALKPVSPLEREAKPRAMPANPPKGLQEAFEINKTGKPFIWNYSEETPRPRDVEEMEEIEISSSPPRQLPWHRPWYAAPMTAPGAVAARSNAPKNVGLKGSRHNN